MKEPLSLYIHIPFCVRKCLYCDFLSFPDMDYTVQKQYVNALLAEMEAYRREAEDYLVTTIFVGGGTPSALKEGLMARIFQGLQEIWRLAEQPEITIECNPGTVNREKLEEYQACGINRISFGLQSANNEELKKIGRIHNYEQFVANYHLAREVGFRNINVDLMSALPGQTMASYGRTLAKVLELRPEHISAYSLIVEEGTPLAESKELLETLPNENQDRAMYQYTKKILHSMGYERYEISNYSLPGYECRHNIGYWTGRSYLGLGLNASSDYQNQRFCNRKDLEAYLRCCNKQDFRDAQADTAHDHKGIKYHVEDLDSDCTMTGSEYEEGGTDRLLESIRIDVSKMTQKDRMEEFMYLGLRLIKGVSEEEFRQRFDCDMNEIYGDVIRKHIAEGLLERRAGRLCLTDRGLDVSNYVFADFLLDTDLS